MENNSILDKFLEFFRAEELYSDLDSLKIHIKRPEEKTGHFINNFREMGSKLNFNVQKFNETLENYVKNESDEDFQKLKDLILKHFLDSKNQISTIKNGPEKSYDALRALIGIKSFDVNFQVYDAMVLLKDEISEDLIKEVIIDWKEKKEYFKSKNIPNFDNIFWWSDDVIDNISMYRFQETFHIEGFDSTFKEVEKELEEVLWEYLPPHELSAGPFYLWLIDRIPNFSANYYDLTKFLENIVKEQNSNGYWENKSLIKSEIIDKSTCRINHIEYEIDTSGTALCSISLIKHSKYDEIKNKGIEGVKWLLEQQNADGSWSDKIISRENFGEIENKKSIFSTLLALEAIIRSEIPNTNHNIDLGLEWIMNKQNNLGMWEEDRFQPLFRHSSFPLMTIFVLELINLYNSQKLLLDQESFKKSSLILPKHDYEFDIAVSFAGEDRELVKKYVSILKSENVSVFYDEDEIENLWGENLYDKLHEIYSSKTKYCVMFISKHYAEKVWTNHERQAAQERALKSLKDNIAYILPVKLDDTEIPGYATKGHVDLRKKNIEELAEITIKKISKN